MITVRLQGGLGNQLFQYAAALAVKKATGASIYFIMFEENVHNKLGHNYTELFEGQCHITLPQTADVVYNQYSSFEAWEPSIYRGESVFLNGYFQYLPAILDVIPEMRLSFLAALRKKVGTRGPLPETGFVHVRRGDYLLNPTYHWVQPVSYYQEGMRIIGAKKWLVFSDDVEWCRQQTLFDSAQIVDEQDELKALELMASCGGGAVISNSSFSWWGAILGGAERVVYPELWSELHRPTLFPSTWIELSSSS